MSKWSKFKYARWEFKCSTLISVHLLNSMCGVRNLSVGPHDKPCLRHGNLSVTSPCRRVSSLFIKPVVIDIASLDAINLRCDLYVVFRNFCMYITSCYSMQTLRLKPVNRVTYYKFLSEAKWCFFTRLDECWKHFPLTTECYPNVIESC